MEASSPKKLTRWPILLIGVLSMMFAGIIYAWSILKAPLSDTFGWNASELALNFTLTMCLFCIGCFIGGWLAKRVSPKITIGLAGLLAGGGFVLTAYFSASSIVVLYFTYAVMGGLGIGLAYNVILSTVSAWYPDRKGFCSGCLMMGFGASPLILGNLAGTMFDNPGIGWQTTYVVLGIALCVVLVATGFLIKRPGADVTLPEPKQNKANNSELFERRDFTPGQMLKRFTFWRAFLCLICLTAVGNTVISFARDLAISVGAVDTLATTLVGVLSVCNGLGRISTGALFDALGRKKTMITANAVTILAAGVTLLAVLIGNLPLCIIGLCLTGLSYGACPTVASAFTSAFYGQKNFSTNFSIMNFNLMGASFMATACSQMLIATGGYWAPYVLLLSLSLMALALNFSIRRP